MYTPPRQLVFLLCLCGITLWCGHASAGPADDQFAVAADHYARGRWQLAAQEFAIFLAKYGDDFPQRAGEAVFFRGEALIQLGDYEQAGRQFERFLAEVPNHKYSKRALYRKAEAAYLAGASTAARDAFQEFRDTYPDDDLLQYALPYLGELTLAAGDAKQAQEIYVDALRRHPAGPLADECRFGLGRALQQQGDAEAAARFFTALAADPDKPRAADAQFQLGIVQYNAGRYREAAETLGKFQSTLAADKHAGEARYWLGLAHLALQQWPDAIRALGDAAGNTRPELAADIAYYTARAHLEAGDRDEAVRHFDRVLANWPDHEKAAAAALAKLHILMQQGDHAGVEAEAARFARRYAASPLSPEVQRVLARSRLAQRDYASATDVLVPLAAATANRSDRYLLAVAQLGAGQYEPALAALDAIGTADGDASLRDAVHVARSSALMNLERYREAAVSLRAYLAAQPEGPDAADCRADLVVALAAVGQWDEAVEAYREYAERHPEHRAVLSTTQYVAEAAVRAGDTQIAREMFEVLVRDGNPPEFVAAGLAGLARLGLDAGQSQGSQDSFNRLRQMQPNDALVADAALQRARSLQKSQQDDAALATFQVIIDEHPRSEQMPAALWEAAGLHIRLKQYREAEQLLERLVREYPQRKTVDGVLYQWAWVLVDLERADEADAVFTRIHLEHPESSYWADSTYRLAERAAEKQDFDRAKQLARGVLAAGAEGTVAAHSLYLLGRIAIREEQWEEALSPLTRLCREHADSDLKPQAQYWLAEASYRLGRWEEAQQQLDGVARDSGPDSQTWLPMVELRQAQVLARQKKWDEALQRASQMAERFPDFDRQYEVDYLIGRCLATAGRFREAREAYERVIQSGRGRPTETAAMAQWMIGETFFHQQNYDEAIRAYARVGILWDFPRWTAAALLQTGKCHEAQDRWQEAVSHYNELLAKYPQTIFAREGERRLSVVRQRAEAESPVVPQTTSRQNHLGTIEK